MCSYMLLHLLFCGFKMSACHYTLDLIPKHEPTPNPKPTLTLTLCAQYMNNV